MIINISFSGYREPEKEYESSEADDEEQSPKKFKEPQTESDFKPSTTFPFKEYDERFGKYRAQSDEDTDDENSHSRSKDYSSSDNDEEEENSSSEYRVKYAQLPRKSHDSSYEEEDEGEEESRKHEERREETEKDSYEVKPKHPKYYGKTFDREFEESYREELPKQSKYKKNSMTRCVTQFYNVHCVSICRIRARKRSAGNR